MIDFFLNFHFLRPLVLLFLLLPLGLFFKKLKFSAESSSWENVCDKKLLDFLLVHNDKSKKISIKKFIYTALIFTIFAAAGPCWRKEEIPTFTVENPNMFVISLAQDMQLNDVPPTRLERAKFMLSDIVDNLKDGQFGIAVYSNEPYIISPIADDANLIKSLLPQIVPNIVPDQGDRLDRAIDLAVERFSAAGFSNGNIILFASDVGQRFDLALEKTKLAVKKNYRIYVVDTSYSGNEKLKLLAEMGNGLYLSIHEISPNKLLDEINKIQSERIIQTENLRSNYIDFGYYLVFVPLLCVLFLFRKGVLVLLFFLWAGQAEAGFLQNRNQEGFSLFQKEDYENAFTKFTDTNWRGLSLYKQDKFEEALTEFAKQKNNVVSLYNKGVTLVKLCKYQEALEAFDEVLKIDSAFADALYNLQVLTDLFEKAKEDPKVLDCDNQQQENQDNNNQNENNDNNEQNQDQNQNQEQEQEQNQDQNQSDNNQQDLQNDNEQQSSQSDNDNKENSEDQQSNQENSQNDSNNNEQQNENNQDNSSSQQNTDDQSEDNGNNPAEANNDNGDENKTDNKPEAPKQGQENQLQEQETTLANVKKGDEDDKYDEEALAMQRQYREIPEDVGGLLREFIKKEYMKDRYKNENM